MIVFLFLFKITNLAWFYPSKMFHSKCMKNSKGGRNHVSYFIQTSKNVDSTYHKVASTSTSLPTGTPP